MSDPADKSDDLIAELAKLMAASPGGDKPTVAPIARPAPLDAAATTPAAAPAAPTPIRIPGMDQPRPAAVAPAQAAAPRAPVTGAIRIPGMDNPAPVATSAPVSKFDFGAKPSAAAPIKQEPLSTLTERLAAQNPSARVEPNLGPSPAPQAAPTPIRIPSDLKPVSENRSFAQGPALSVAKPAAAPAPAAAVPSAPASNGGGDFGFDFGFGRNPPASATPPRPTEEVEEHDPIADLIASSMDESDVDDTPAPAQQAAKPAPGPVTPIVRQAVTPQQVQKPAITPIGGAPRPSNSQPIPLKPVSVAPRAPEADRFAVSPGVGLNIKPQPSQQLSAPVQRAPELPKPAYDHSDPMSEIESLIGEAVRVELSPPGPVKVQAVQQKVSPHVEIEPDLDIDGDGEADTASAVPVVLPKPQPTAAPVVPPLTTQFAPRRANLKDDVGQTSAEDAILAAAAATGAQVDHIEPTVGDESPYRRLKVKPARSSFASGGIRQYIGMAVAGTLLLAAGLGLYWVLNMGRTNTIATGDNAPQLTADATPVKAAPATTAAAEPEARSPVMEQMEGTSVEPSTEQLVSTDETASTPVTRDVTNVAATEDDTEGGLANRKVRTVTVRPDGTIVSGDDAVAGAEELPVDRPNVPEMPSSDTTNLLGDTTAVAATDPATDTSSPAPLTADTPAASTEPVQTAEAAVQAIPNAGGVAPTPISLPVRSPTVTAFVDDTPAAPATEVTGAQTPNGQIDLLGSPIEVASNDTPAATPAAPVSSGNAAAYVQLSSSPSEADANASMRSLNNKFGSLFGGSKLIVQSADLGQKGTWYRVKLPASSLASAQSVCSDIKANGGDCIVTGG